MDSQELRSLQEAYLDIYTEDRDGYGDKFTQDTDADKFIPGKSVPKVKKFGRPFGKYAPSKIILNDILKKLPPEEKKKPSREIVRKTKKEDFELWVNELLDEGYDLSGYTWEGLYETYIDVVENQQLNELTPATPQNIQRAVKRRQKQFNRTPMSNSTGGSGEERQALQKLDRVERMANNRGVSAESVDIYDIILSHLIDEGYADTFESAEAIMVNMSEDWRESICDEVLDEKTASPAPRYNVRNRLDANKRRLRRSSDFYTYGGENQDPDERTISTSKGEGGITKNPKKLRKQQIMGEH